MPEKITIAQFIKGKLDENLNMTTETINAKQPTFTHVKDWRVRLKAAANTKPGEIARRPHGAIADARPCR